MAPKTAKRKGQPQDIEIVATEDVESKPYVQETAETEDVASSSGSELEDLDSNDSFDEEMSSDDGEEKQTSTFADGIAEILNAPAGAENEEETPILSLSKKSRKVLHQDREARKANKLRRLRRRERLREENVGRIARMSEYGEDKIPEVLQRERNLRRIAQRGVVQLFNAVRSTQVKAKQTAQTVSGGRTAREQKVNELSKTSFLDLIKS
ncbi:rRNA processing protein Rrp15 [Schizosaccharomyces japonicus yFS275]|uniref:rRNA processing protein Rrp15 n=1 Tax=Schizosaccharomyces japonicus (strain yFS275 / FY16936) TaxID=402676 RepID=B6K6J7_SCHJY|nr:rRNA processing protein Rrp15 [Schizosaccharomyces japonicus yFS275]EEB09151.1 rRNA processing protein Rrp15 [Schizosaccharomyces japonicus yFS275]